MQSTAQLLSITILIGIGISIPAIAQNTFPPTGNVGVGTSTPQTAVHIMAAENPNCAAQLRLEAQTSTPPNGCGPSSAIWDISSFGANTLTLTTPSIGIPVMTWNGLGNVGINTAAPTARLHIAGTVKIADGTQGPNKVLTSDATGLASWQALPGGGIGGSGPVHSLAKFTGATTIGGSQITDNGSTVAISSLQGGGPRMVVASAAGVLSAQAIPPPPAGDNLGNHTAVVSLKMNSHGIFGVDFVEFDNGHRLSSWGAIDSTLSSRLTIGSNLPPNYTLHVDGYAVSDGWLLFSDARYKKNIEPLAKPLDTIMALRGVRYEFAKNAFPRSGFSDGTKIGFIAQDVAQILPEAVKQDSDGYYAIDYSVVIPVLVEAVKAQQAMIERQSKRIEELEKGASRRRGHRGR